MRFPKRAALSQSGLVRIKLFTTVAYFFLVAFLWNQSNVPSGPVEKSIEAADPESKLLTENTTVDVDLGSLQAVSPVM